ncbi:hypothetical protein [Spirilliplanes yamanashiensis]|uniref:Uncharacterized protein n=1 Tax=Spirilliplanes yamanashiensis TaxID=42233 RepID=A0A8J3Y9Y0_9ACTN|nr:hypothetical protein [Spirilliplanes yamanashiensis]MDP9817813.1 hypothetical protein [Spirilliplanes yamanashiensis]GIJ04623.1 hypothetical protein Sya03_39750 [Spirilliplanes yamanashiensis]
MLRSVELTAVLALSDAPFHNLHWKSDVELSLDCFICQRTGRTTALQHGAEQGTCSGESKTGRHPAPARVSAFDHTTERGRTILRAVVDYWWAPFHDAERDQPSSALTRTPWVRLHLGYLCPQPAGSGTISTQSNLIRPQTHTCEHCAAPIAHSHETPRIQLLTQSIGTSNDANCAKWERPDTRDSAVVP